MGKLVDKKRGGSGKRPASTRPSHSSELSPAGAKIVSAFREAIDVMRSGESLPGRLTARSHYEEFVRPSYGPEDVRRVRGLLGMSQVVLRDFLESTPTRSARGSKARAPLVLLRAGSWGRSKRIPRIGDSGLHVKSSIEPKLMSLALRETADIAVPVLSVFPSEDGKEVSRFNVAQVFVPLFRREFPFVCSLG